MAQQRSVVATTPGGRLGRRVGCCPLLPPHGLPDGRDDDGADDRADDAGSPQVEAVAADEAGDETADERPGDASDDGHPPVDATLLTTDDELRDGADEGTETEDGKDQHGPNSNRSPR